MAKAHRVLHFIFLPIFCLAISACNGSDSGSGDSTASTSAYRGRNPWKSPTPTATPAPTATPTPTATPAPSSTPNPSPTASPSPTPTEEIAVIYNGPGATATGVTAIGDILRQHGLKYVLADHTAFNAMSLATMTKYSLMIFPGGDSNDMHAALTDATRLRVKQAIITYGVNYTGFCAGAWMAVGPAQSVSSVPYWGFGFVTGDYLKQYYPNGQDPEAAMLNTRFATGETRNLVWYRGPILPNLSGKVLARYPDGSPAFIGTFAGKGYVTLTGPHPEAPSSWRYGLNDTDGLDYDIAWRVIESALDKRALTAF